MLEEFSHLFHSHLNNSLTFRLEYFSNDFLSHVVGYYINNNITDNSNRATVSNNP